jgi:peptide/nickel transport system substrate-binding protein
MRRKSSVSIRSGRVGRRGAATIALIASATLLAGGVVTVSTSTVSAATPVKGGTVTYDMELAPACSDPEVSSQFTTYQIARPVVDSLVASSNGKVFKPWLATHWTVSANAEHYIFFLRKGVTFSDGTPLNAAAVKYNFDRIVAPATKSQYAVSLMGPYESTTVINDYEVEVNFKTGFNSFLFAASTPNLGIQSPTALKKNPPCSAPVGSGPFVITQYNAETGATLTNRPSYAWDPGTVSNKGAAYLSTLIFNFVPTDATRVGSLTSGQATIVEAAPATDVSALKKEGYDVIHQPQAGGVYDMYISQKSGKAPWNELDGRLALRDALNVPGMIKALYDGVYQPAWSPIAANTPDFDPAVVNSWSQNVKEADKLLGTLGYTKRDSAGCLENSAGRQLDIVLDSVDSREQRLELGLLIKQEEAQAGIDVIINSDETTAIADIYDGGFGIMASAHVEASPDVLRQLYDSADFPASGGLNDGLFKNSQVDTWLTEATESLNPATEKTLYDDVQAYVVKNAVSIPLYQELTLDAASSKLKGLTYDATGYVQYYDAYLAK